MPTTLSRRVGMGWGPQQPATDDIGNASVVTLGNGFDLNSRTSYTTTTLTTGTGTFPSVAGIPIYVHIQSLVVGGPNTPTVTFTDGTNTDTLAIIPEASDQAAVDKKKWTFGFIPTFTTPSGWFVISYAGQTQQEQRWYVIKGVGLYTLGGIGETYVADGFTGSDNSGNATSFSLAVQGVMDQNNVCLGLLWAGDAQLTTSPGVGSPSKLGDSVPHGSATTTFGIYYTIGDPSGGRIGMNWAGSFSNGGHYLELRSAASALPRLLRSGYLAPVIHNTSPTSSTTYPAGGGNILPARGDLLVLVAVHTNTAGSLRNVNAFGGTMTKDGTNPPVWNVAANIPVDFNTVGAPTQRMHVYTANIDGEPTAGTVIFNLSAGITGLHLGIYRIPGAGSTGLAATAKGTGDASTAVSTGTLPATPGDGVLMFTGYSSSNVGQDQEGSGYVRIEDGQFAAPSSGLATTWRHTPDATPDALLLNALDWGAWAGEVQPGPITAYPRLIDQSGAPFAPLVDQQVKPFLIDQSGALFSPQVNLSVADGFIDQSGTPFGPSVNQQVALASFVDQSGVAFSPTVGEQVKPSLIDQHGTLFAPQVNLQVKPGLIDHSGALFVLKANEQVQPVLLDQSGTPFNPVVSQAGVGGAQFVRMTAGNLSEVGRYAGLSLDEAGRYVQGGSDELGRYVLPSAVGGVGTIDQSGVLFAPVVEAEQDVAPSLIDQHGTLFGPSINQQVLPGLVDRHGVLFNPTMSVGTVSIAPPLIDRSGTLFGPQANQQVRTVVIDQSGVAFGPSAVQVVSPELVDQSGTTFGPTVRQAVSSALVDQHGVPFGPTLAQQVRPDLIDSSGLTIAPSAAQQVRPVLLDQSGTPFAPSVGLSVSPALIDQHGVLFGPGARGQVEPEVIDQSGTPFAFSVGGGVKPGTIDQSGITFAPKVNAAVGPGTIDSSGVVIALQQLLQKVFAALIDQHGQAFAPSIVLAPPQVVLPGRIDRTGVAFAPQRVHTVVVEDVAKTALAEPGVSKVALLDPGAQEPR